MIGGGHKIKQMLVAPDGSVIFILIALLILRAYVVQVTYNMMWPKLVRNSGSDSDRFTPLTFYEALMVTILFSFLFRF